MKNSGRLFTTDESNRVYRAPAYYQSKTMDVAHFNPAVNLVAYSKPKTANDNDLKTAYPNMTAIDFAGHNDNTWTLGRAGGAPAGVDLFYQPLLDENGLTSITNRDESDNLLVYTPSAGEHAQTYGVLTTYFVDPSYDDYDDNSGYRRVAAAPYWTVFGHLVQNNLTATSDHLLVDKQAFNCPISYTFAPGKRMWYQRMPDLYVSLNKGWESVSLPFTAELVSTQDKGEITHFYSGSRTIEGSEAKIGHEYWLRKYLGEKAGTTITDGIFTAAFNYPDAAGDDKQVGNTFLWDYYYSKNTQKDAHTDTYQTYYETGRNLEQYPLLARAEPYIIGFPGKTYYEFDLSGEFVARNTAETAPEQLDKQSISFVSVPNITIAVSDDELATKSVTEDGYKFVPNYMSKKVEGFLMNTEGSRFDVTPDGGLVTVPFRPYFVAAPQNSAPRRSTVKSILFDNEDSSFAIGEDKDPSSDNPGEGDLVITVRRRTISASSTLRREADVRIVNTAGITIANFTIQPGETIDTNVPTAGVYIVRADGGRIQKKFGIK